jgi:predicted house-cleaning noncanonical NTP pyrophosphatase (MazG superfamily)
MINERSRRKTSDTKTTDQIENVNKSVDESTPTPENITLKTTDQIENVNKSEDESTPTPENITLKPMEMKIPEIYPEDIMGQIQQQLAENPKEFSASVADAPPKKIDSLSREQANKVIKVFAEKSNTTVRQAVIGISSLVQAGGTNASIPPITKVVNGQKFELRILRDCVAFVTEKKGTVRQLAKTMRDVIYEIASQNGWQGPLATALKKEYPEKEFTAHELMAAGEFHEDNMEPYMPKKVRDALVDRAKRLATEKLKKQQQSKPNRKGGKKKKR